MTDFLKDDVDEFFKEIIHSIGHDNTSQSSDAPLTPAIGESPNNPSQLANPSSELSMRKQAASLQEKLKNLQWEAQAKSPESAPKVILNTAHARAMLRLRYCQPEWVFAEEVAPETGGGTRYADGIAINLWQSRGHSIIGFEVKVSRADFLKEIKDPAKAEPVFKYCDQWFIVAPKGVVKEGELPAAWGLLELREKGLTQIVAAPKQKPVPVDRKFFASLIRRAFEQVDKAAAVKAHKASQDAWRSVEEQSRKEIDRRTREFRAREAAIKKFEDETGLSIESWRGPSVNAVKLAQKLDSVEKFGSGALNRVTRMADELSRAAAAMRSAVAESGFLPHETKSLAQLVDETQADFDAVAEGLRHP